LYTTLAIDEPHFDLDVTLGLFDGISCGQEALKRAGITTRIYLASEIEKYPKIITRKNHPLTVQLGDVRDVKGENLPKVDLILGGSPCTGFSFAGKGLAFDDPRSALFFEFVRVLEECREFNPDVKFLLENVMMKKEFKDIITEHLGVEPVMINSSLVSAQNRKRLYWTNIPGVGQPDDKGILLKDVLEDFVGDKHSELEKHILSGKTVEKITRHNNRIVKEQSNPDKSAAIHAGYYKMGGRDQQYLIDREPAVLVVPEATKKGYTEIEDGACFDATFMSSKTRRRRNMKDKSNCLTAANYDYMRYEHPTYRKLTPVECERLQTLPDNYTEGVSNTQRYKALGNGWTVDVIVHILQGLKWLN